MSKQIKATMTRGKRTDAAVKEGLKRKAPRKTARK